MSCDWECDRGVNQKQTDVLFVVGRVSEVQAIKAHPSYLFIYLFDKITSNTCIYLTFISNIQK